MAIGDGGEMSIAFDKSRDSSERFEEFSHETRKIRAEKRIWDFCRENNQNFNLIIMNSAGICKKKKKKSTNLQRA